MEKIDQGIESTELLEAEIDNLLRRLIYTTPNGAFRVHQVVKKVLNESVVGNPKERIQRAVELHASKQIK